MRNNNTISVIIPALNEEKSIGKVIADIPEWIDEIIVVDNGSTDSTVRTAGKCGAKVVSEPGRGYGSACLAGMANLKKPDVVVFLDGDYSDYPGEMHILVDPVIKDKADMVIGSRTIGEREPGALTPQALFGNWLACNLINLFWSFRYTDLGPFRAIRYTTLKQLQMQDRNYGWTVEMQIKAIHQGARVIEVPVRYRARIGQSKISRTFKGVISAGIKIIYTIFLYLITLKLFNPKFPGKGNIVVFTRYPVAGTAKTRLIPELGPEGAAELQRKMTLLTLKRVKNLIRKRSVSHEIRYEGGDKKLISKWLGNDLNYLPQGEGDLGARMAQVFLDSNRDGKVGNTIIIGTDCPGISVKTMESAFDSLKSRDIVLGTAEDGGYYLVGMGKNVIRTAVPEIFSDIEWGTRNVLRQTMLKISGLGLSFKLLSELADIDRPEDLVIWKGFEKKISVIIPALNEESHVSHSIKSAAKGENVEIIVVDGGSTDNTKKIAGEYDTQILDCSAGIASQMNMGAAASQGDCLLFLHADTILPENYDDHVRMNLAKKDTMAGAFELKFDGNNRIIRIIEKLANWRSRKFKLPYGDQAIFLNKESFREIGGFPDIPIMEDFEFMRIISGKGEVEIVSEPVITSPRRWLRLGIIGTTVLNQIIIIAYLAGVPPQYLAKMYNKKKK